MFSSYHLHGLIILLLLFQKTLKPALNFCKFGEGDSYIQCKDDKVCLISSSMKKSCYFIYESLTDLNMQ